jgi:MoxR-like ATPase
MNTKKKPGLLEALGILGWGDIEPAILAALATSEPLLLVGPHGTAKSLLLERLAEALDLRFRHYNASVLNFDDLVGFPVPDGDRVRYLRTPLDAWDAEAIFVDEISRCRPDLQNRLFPLIHERRLQGERLERLRYRWAAMNPPPPPDADPEEIVYLGAEPLDAALADRFSFIISVPVALSQTERLALIRGPEPAVGAAAALRAAVAETRGRLALVTHTHGEQIAAYVDFVGLALNRAGLPLSNRRLGVLYRNILGVLATGRVGEIGDAARLALTWSLPQRAQGAVEEEAVLRAHVSARKLLAEPDDSLRRALLAEADPVARVVLALSSPDDDLLTATVLDARAALDEARRLALSTRLFPLLAETRPALPGFLFEALAEEVGQVNGLSEATESVDTRSARYRLANDISRRCAELKEREAWIGDVLWAAFRAHLELEPAALVSFAQALARRLPAPGAVLGGVA